MRLRQFKLHVNSSNGIEDPSDITNEALTAEVQSMVGQGTELLSEFGDAAGELYVSTQLSSWHTCGAHTMHM